VAPPVLTGLSRPSEPPVLKSEAIVLASATENISTFKLTAYGEQEMEKPAEPKLPSVPASEKDTPIDLATAFRLAGVDNPTINLAHERVTEALAQRLAARSLLLPSLTVGGNYHLHTGPLQRSSGSILDVQSQSFYFGAGARTLAAESVAFPGIRLFSHLGDAYYEPLVAQQRWMNRRADARSVQNQVLLDVAEAYMGLLRAEARLEVLRTSETDVKEIVRLTRAYAETGQGRDGDAKRAATNEDFLRKDLELGEGELAVASVRLAELLSLDPSVRLHTPGGKIPTIQLVDETQPLDQLLATALEKRPEIAAQTAAILEAQARVRQEQVRPFLPLVSIGVSGGAFGGGSNLVSSMFGPFAGRADVDVFAVWTLQNGGVGNLALTRRASAILGQNIAELSRVRNEIRDQVSEAVANAQAASSQLEVARRAFTSADEGFREEMLRIKQLPGFPLEAIDSFRLLVDSRQELVRAVMGYNIAQFRLFVAVGVTPDPESIPPLEITPNQPRLDPKKP
jgi:outer membrane protein TolC